MEDVAPIKPNTTTLRAQDRRPLAALRVLLVDRGQRREVALDRPRELLVVRGDDPEVRLAAALGRARLALGIPSRPPSRGHSHATTIAIAAARRITAIGLMAARILDVSRAGGGAFGHNRPPNDPR